MKRCTPHLVPVLFLVSLLLLAALSRGAAAATIWPASTTPVVVDEGADSPVELGVKFTADVAGTISGIRFYKAGSNSGTHVGSLWTASGTRLASVTFTGETPSGWQQAQFAAPVAISAGTVYVASYHTTVGHYSDDLNYFAGKGVDAPPLHAPANGVSGYNGVYAYGPAGSFPSSGWNASNYWVDVVFTPAGGGTGTDTAAPTVTAFTVPATATSLTVPVTTFTATDNVGVTGYVITESSSAPGAGAPWSATSPGSYTSTGAGTKTLYAWARDAAGNISAARTATVTITVATGTDKTRPIITSFTIPATAITLSVPITSFTASDNVGVTGYLLTETSTTPALTAGWSATAPGSYTFAAAGTRTLYAWVRDGAGNRSASKRASVTITLAGSRVEPAGWYAGDMHVHRSCGGSPEATSTFPSKMAAQNLTFISLLADMGNGEVQNAATDLPLVNGQNSSVSTAGRTVHWDAEWHWDPIYFQYPHQALGGHVVALGLSEAHQVWEEYTTPIFDWAHRQNAVAGFVHMQYLDNGIPQTLSCCTPLEYPVEVALGGSDFISEDVVSGGSSVPGQCPECAMEAYYRLLNCGFRPGLAAGTDYPCNGGEALGSLLTYVQTGGDTSYRAWIDGIAAGKTVISRNGHREFLSLTVNGTATPGDQVNLAAAGTVPVTIQWTSQQQLSGTVELLQNGEVVASRQASAGPGAPASLTATVNFTGSGWLAARRMGANGHMVHTAAVFVTVNGAPVRASAADALFYVQWIDNLLNKTSSGGAWSYYFTNSRSAAQARYQSAKAIYEQIAREAEGGVTPPPPPPPSTDQQTIFTTQVPTVFDNDGVYELGTRFWPDVNGTATQVRIYTTAQEGGTHTVRIWRVRDSAVVGGPYSWNVAAGTTGWRSFPLPAAVALAAGTEYIVSVSNSSDRYYAEQSHGFDSGIVNGHLHTGTGGGVYTERLGSMPTSNWENANYFRDLVFVPD